MPPVHLRRSQHPESSVSYASGPPSEPPSEAPSIGESFTPSPEAGNTRPPQRKTGIDLYWAQIDSQQELPGDEDLSDFMHVYRRHNSSLPVLEGQMILCRVLSVSRQSLLLDTGTSTARCLHSQISPAQLVQSSRTDTSTRTGPSDYRVGDLIKFRLEDIMSPYGDVVLETRANAKSPAKDDVFAELVEAYEKRVSDLGLAIYAFVTCCTQACHGTSLEQCKRRVRCGRERNGGLLPLQPHGPTHICTHWGAAALFNPQV
ncbi:hypothetical protein WJX74_002589 [Apatococcus lobatus]|uniref:Uncharacterized protein n=2 Tax=Apatococcus TaxID=904362 RepID=A0AAW1TG96_9CHLO